MSRCPQLAKTPSCRKAKRGLIFGAKPIRSLPSNDSRCRCGQFRELAQSFVYRGEVSRSGFTNKYPAVDSGSSPVDACGWEGSGRRWWPRSWRRSTACRSASRRFGNGRLTTASGSAGAKGSSALADGRTLWGRHGANGITAPSGLSTARRIRPHGTDALISQRRGKPGNRAREHMDLIRRRNLRRPKIGHLHRPKTGLEDYPDPRQPAQRDH